MPARNKARLFNSEVSVWDNRDNLWVSLRGQLLLPSVCLVLVSLLLLLLLLVFLSARACSLRLLMLPISRPCRLLTGARVVRLPADVWTY